ncbi:hypothetical protein OHB31_18775 [Streptomyces microflavus]|uniref:hypothetical protein n=1 Tax=Streptomyces griseus group TaxID=629295 RepID=UPI002DDAC370|nr:hypothetical protein [Streptomyces microflavus]WSA62078.1 hypothetical protein OHB31_18775 [Streptomyces microflavus]
MTTSHTHLRLLPWAGPEGKPAHLVTDNTASPLALLADRMEAQQIETAAVVVSLAKPMVEESADLTADELRWIARRLCESLTDVLNVAESRGQRVPPYESADD